MDNKTVTNSKQGGGGAWDIFLVWGYFILSVISGNALAVFGLALSGAVLYFGIKNINEGRYNG